MSTPDSLLKVMSDTSDPVTDKDEGPRPIEFEWKPVSHWPTELRDLLREIPDIEHALRALRKPDGHAGSDSEIYRAAIDVLEQALVHHRESLAAGILSHLDIPHG